MATPSNNRAVRTRGAKPANLEDRRQSVREALRDLEEIGAAFSMADVAERAGISRATLYRDASLRELVGARGDQARPVDPRIHDRICSRHKALQATVRELRRRLKESERTWEEMRERAQRAEHQLVAAQKRLDAVNRRLTDRPAHGGHLLGQAAAAIGPEGMRRARRHIALALHPDLYAQDPDTAAIAGELLRALNDLVD
ncbi:MAG: hypothetical protein ACLQVD_09520 [Capsulimonadaceae bacterium]